MMSISKETMIQYLKDYANIQDIAVKNPDVSIGELFDKYMKDNGKYEDEYGGFRIDISVELENIKEKFHVDVATGNPITPKEIAYKYKPIPDYNNLK